MYSDHLRFEALFEKHIQMGPSEPSVLDEALGPCQSVQSDARGGTAAETTQYGVMAMAYIRAAVVSVVSTESSFFPMTSTS